MNSELDFQALQDLDQFCLTVYNRTYSFQCGEKINIDGDDRLTTFTLLDEERQLLTFAQEMGKEYVRVYCNAVQKASQKLMARSPEEKMAMVIMDAVDPELKEYARALQHHDWYHAYSDDIGVYRRGQENEEVLKAKADKGSFWKTLWNHFSNKK